MAKLYIFSFRRFTFSYLNLSSKYSSNVESSASDLADSLLLVGPSEMKLAKLILSLSTRLVLTLTFVESCCLDDSPELFVKLSVA